MARRWVWWTAGGLLLVVLLALGAWRLSGEIPDRLRKAEEEIREEAARRGLRVTYGNLKLHFLYPRISLDNVEIRDAGPDLLIARAETVDVALSPGRLLSGGSPVSRVRARNFLVQLEDANRPLIDRLRASKGGGGAMPEILLLGGKVRLGPIGPVTRWEARVPELRAREVRFLGTRVSLQAEDASGSLVLPGTGDGAWPFRSIEADFFYQDEVLRFRRIRASGPAASLRVSGDLDMKRRSGDLKASGTVELDRWVSGGAPGAPWLGRIAEKGNVEFSVVLAGTPADPDGTAKLVLRNGRFRGGTGAEGEATAAVAKRRVSLESVKGKVLGGTLIGSGSYDLRRAVGEVRVALRRASFGAAPWKEWGVPWRPAGTGDLEVAFSGTRSAVRGSVTWRNPEGLERVGTGDAPGGRIRLPLSAVVDAAVTSKGDVSFSSLRIRAGEAEVAGKGDVSLEDRRLALAGTFSVPRGRAAEYGWDYPLSWGALAGDWEAAGAAARPRFAARIEAQSLAARELPPVPLVVKLEGDSADVVHFVADIPARAAKATVTGTLTSPLSRAHFALDASVAARDIDFGEGGRWAAAILASLGKDPEPAARYASGLSGMGTADAQVSVSAEGLSVAGALQSATLTAKGVTVRAVSVEGQWDRSRAGETWRVRAAGAAEEGSVRLEATGGDGAVEATATAETVDLGHAVSLVSGGKGPTVRGTARFRLAARNAGTGWEIGHFSGDAPRVTVDNTAWEGVSAEGTLGLTSGRVVLSAKTPDIRVTADVQRGGEWPVAFVAAANGVPTEFLLAVGGRSGVSAGGKWEAHAAGTVPGVDLASGKEFSPRMIRALRFTVAGTAPSVSGVTFQEVRADGEMRGEAITGEVRSRAPDTRLSYTLSLREPLGFRLEGPFSFGTPANGKEGDAEARYAISGRAEIAGSLRAPEQTRGVLEVGQLRYRNGGMELAGKDVTAAFSPEGIRWSGGTLLMAGNPVRVSGKVSWKGDLDARLDGKVPAAAIRLVTDVFDRLDGTMRLDVRLTGKWNNPSVVGAGRLEGGIFSFRGYAQLFEDMRADAIISREKLIFEHFEGRSGGGYIDGRGELPLRFDAHQRLFFSADFFDMRFPYPDDFRPVVQGHVELLGPYDDFVVTGDVEVQSARYTKTLRPEKALLDFRRRLQDVTARKEPSEFRVRLDIDGIADGTVRIKNNIADATVKGEFKVVGDTSRVIVLGAFDVVDGLVEYQGNRYEVRRANVEFQDPRRNNPRLDIRAETKKGNVTVIVSVTGTLEKYEVDLASDPPLSKNDIVSLLSLGVTSQALTGSEGTVGAAAASSIVLGTYKGSVEEGIRGIVGLDKFAIEPSFSTSSKSFEPRFIVGKSFGERLSVSISTGVGTATESNAVAEYKLLENIFLQGDWESATTTRQGDLGADIKFRYRYRQLKDFLRGRD